MKKNFPHYLIWGLLTALYTPVFIQLYRSRWETIDYTHAYFILPLSLWFVWTKRDFLVKNTHDSTSAASFASLTSIIIGCAMFVFGWKQDYLFIATLSLIPILFGIIHYLYGKYITKALLFPILYLLLLVPPPLGILDSITLPMRQGISIASAAILQTFQYPIVRDGLLLLIGDHEIYMGAPCSGFRSLITMISLGIAYVYITKSQRKTKIALLTAIVPLALLGNLIRVTSMCLVTFYFGDDIGHKYHDLSGFVIFIILILGLIGIENIFEKKDRKKSSSKPPAA